MINIPKSKQKTNVYDTISNDKRFRLIEMVSNKCLLKDAARILNMNYSTAKTIFRVYKKEKRILRKYPTKFDNRNDEQNKHDIHKLNALKEFLMLSIERQKLNYTIHNNNNILSMLSNFLCKLSQL